MHDKHCFGSSWDRDPTGHKQYFASLGSEYFRSIGVDTILSSCWDAPEIMVADMENIINVRVHEIDEEKKFEKIDEALKMMEFSQFDGCVQH